ncbi:MAG: hypothetical protein H0U53_01045 [Actinobacteria bacterium]|nr:hypothetical protein [Actinomycetota bacterium]
MKGQSFPSTGRRSTVKNVHRDQMIGNVEPSAGERSVLAYGWMGTGILRR